MKSLIGGVLSSEEGVPQYLNLFRIRLGKTTLQPMSLAYVLDILQAKQPTASP